ncbi:MAG: response regulator transcription factor [Pseudomonadales bacterium]
MKLLLVEDDCELVSQLKPLLTKAGYAVEVADNGVDGAFLGHEIEFDLVVLDLGLPEKNGLQVLQEWRSAGNKMPVLILTARDAWFERVEGLKAGADDYLGKPFHSEELLARLQSIARRQRGPANNLLQWRGVTLDIDTQSATNQQGQNTPLTAKEYRLLRYLMQHPRQVHSKTLLSEHIYEEDQLKDSNVIEVYINRLRNLFGKEFIETRRGQGYQLRQQD